MRKTYEKHRRQHQYSRMAKRLASGLQTILIGLIGALAIIGMIIGASIQHQDRLPALAAMEVGE